MKICSAHVFNYNKCKLENPYEIKLKVKSIEDDIKYVLVSNA